MRKVFASALLATVCLGAMAAISSSSRPIAPGAHKNIEAQFAADGAFRDGLYLGKLAAGQGHPLHLAVGRWSTGRDRTNFSTGYRQGYGNSLAQVVRDRPATRPACTLSSAVPALPGTNGPDCGSIHEKFD